ncbi:MAG: hypothetical protein ACOCW6_00545 [Spirochaetota bacterium]
MTVYRLHIQTLPGGVVRLQLGWGWRVFFLAVTVAVVVALVQEGRLGGLLPVIGLVSLLAALFEEYWLFDPASDLVENRVGLLFLTRLRRYRLSNLRSILVRTRAQADPDRERGRGPSRPPGRPGASAGRPPIPSAIQRGYVQLILELAGEEHPEELRGVIVETESLRHRERVTALAGELGEALEVPVKTRFG